MNDEMRRWLSEHEDEIRRVLDGSVLLIEELRQNRRVDDRVRRIPMDAPARAA